jgi:hypothetical protein
MTLLDFSTQGTCRRPAAGHAESMAAESAVATPRSPRSFSPRAVALSFLSLLSLAAACERDQVTTRPETRRQGAGLLPLSGVTD